MKYKMMFIVILLISSLFACSNTEKVNKKKDAAVIQPAELTKHQQNLFNSLGIKDLLLFDIEVFDEDVKYVHYWVDVYKNGKKENSFLSAGRILEHKKMTLSFGKHVIKVDDTEGYEQWNISLIDKGGISSYQSAANKTMKNSMSEGHSAIGEKTPMEVEKSLVVGLTIRDSDGSISLSLSEDEIESYTKKYEEVYVYRVLLTNKEPS